MLLSAAIPQNIEIAEAKHHCRDNDECAWKSPDSKASIAHDEDSGVDAETDDVDQRVTLCTERSLLNSAAFDSTGQNTITPIEKHHPDQENHSGWKMIENC